MVQLLTEYPPLPTKQPTYNNKTIFETAAELATNPTTPSMEHSNQNARGVYEYLRIFDPEVTELNLSNLGLQSVPTPIQNLSKLTSLNLSQNPLKTLPMWLGSMKNLRMVELPQQS